MPTDRRSYDTSVSGQVQGDLAGIIGRLQALIGDRTGHVAQALSDFQADGVSDPYQSVETRWDRAANEVQQIIDLVKHTLALNDESATAAQVQAANAVANIG
ncbi:pore-forming ESAT-6 family protein [Actinosynnema sp. CS-041913]|uniref:pore-forming ESAT-6 family protein n=1 Tax=Actinosynnema sp. CS-041913 TaxID=3239917 RepID=UPI003D937724